jgi:hypothetical protein
MCKKKKQSNHVYRICERCVSKRKPKLQPTTESEPEVEGWAAGSNWPRRRFEQDGTMYDTSKAKCVYTDSLQGEVRVPDPLSIDALYITNKGVLFTYSGKVMQNGLQLLMWMRQGPPERGNAPELINIIAPRVKEG